MEFPRKISCLSAMIMFCLSGGTAFADTTIQPVNGNINLATNNVPVVNINQPGQDGVSHNQYSKFDVGSQGVVLNNAQGGTQSQLAGAINANANLSAGAAKVILNEINSSDKTLLNGMIEVAGQKADVIVANRSGITCNGCGFINTGTGVLTTGELQFKDKQFTGYNVTDGTVTFEGKGLQKGDVDYTAVIARAENINAAVQAKSLLVLAGKKNVTADLDLTRYTNLDNKDKSPEVLVDVSQLGGMYAGKIVLIANENGVGINDSTPVSLRNNGEVVTDGGDMLLSATALTNTGKIAAGGNASLQTTALSNQGNITANNALNIGSASFSNAKDISAKNNIDIKSTTTSNSGKIVSQQGGVTVSDMTFSNNGTIQAKNNISHKGMVFSNNGTLTSTQGSVFDNGRDINYRPPVVTQPANPWSSWASSWWYPRW